MSVLQVEIGLKSGLMALLFISSVACGSEMQALHGEGPSVASLLGLTQYVEAIDPIEDSFNGDETTYTFDSDQGPICMRGEPYRMTVRDTGSEDLVIFLQGGGACWSEFCLAVTEAPAGVPAVDILNPDLSANPVRDWNVVYLPYCDGSFFAGDVSIDDNLNDKGIRHHRGLANLTAALEVAAIHFPAPRRIFLGGSSGGAYGLLLGAPLARHYYPDTELIVMADSGIGLTREGDEAYLDVILDELNLRRFLPVDCPECIDQAHLTGILGYFLDRDENTRVAMFSSWYDTVLSKTFLQVEPELFAESLEGQTGALHNAHPERFRRFIVDGTQHTSLLADPTGIIGTNINAVELPPGALTDLLSGDLLIGGLESTFIESLTMSQWLSAFVENDLDVWVDILETAGPAPD
jgi:hypothetical protein